MKALMDRKCLHKRRDNCCVKHYVHLHIRTCTYSSERQCNLTLTICIQTLKGIGLMIRAILCACNPTTLNCQLNVACRRLASIENLPKNHVGTRLVWFRIRNPNYQNYYRHEMWNGETVWWHKFRIFEYHGTIIGIRKPATIAIIHCSCASADGLSINTSENVGGELKWIVFASVCVWSSENRFIAWSIFESAHYVRHASVCACNFLLRTYKHTNTGTAQCVFIASFRAHTTSLRQNRIVCYKLRRSIPLSLSLRLWQIFVFIKQHKRHSTNNIIAAIT